MKSILTILFSFLLCSVCFADTSAVRHYKSETVILKSEWSPIEFNSFLKGDTFEIGYINDTNIFIIQNDAQDIFDYVFSYGDNWHRTYDSSGKVSGAYVLGGGLKYYYLLVRDEQGKICGKVFYVEVEK